MKLKENNICLFRNICLSLQKRLKSFKQNPIKSINLARFLNIVLEKQKENFNK